MKKNYLILHLSFFMLSIPALFAKGIEMPAAILIWWRCLFGAAVAFIIMLILKKVKVSAKNLKWLAITGTIMGLHWWTYFASIQLSTVAIGLISFFTYPIISVIIEPLFFKTRISVKQIIGGIGIILGVFFLVPEFSFANNITLGITVGIISALFFALRGVLTRKHLGEVPALTTMGYHILFAFFINSITLFLFARNFETPSLNEAGLILILASFFTIGSHGLVVYSLKHFTMATIGILGGLQVVYGTILAFLIFKETPSVNFYIGGLTIIGVSVFEMLPLKRR